MRSSARSPNVLSAPRISAATPTPRHVARPSRIWWIKARRQRKLTPALQQTLPSSLRKQGPITQEEVVAGGRDRESSPNHSLWLWVPDLRFACPGRHRLRLLRPRLARDLLD